MIIIEVYSGENVPDKQLNDKEFGEHPLMRAKYARSIINRIKNEAKIAGSLSIAKKYYSNSYEFISMIYYYSLTKLYGLDYKVNFYLNNNPCEVEDLINEVKLKVDKYIDQSIEQASDEWERKHTKEN